MPMPDWLSTAFDIGGKAFDFLDDNEWLGQTITRLIADNPELDYDKILEMAIVQAKLNAPNMVTPQGSTSTTYDEESGQFNVEQEYSPQIQALYEMLVGNAGAPIDAYQNPEQMGEQMLGGLMNQRLGNMGMPQQEFTRRDFKTPGVQIPAFTDDDDEEDDPVRGNAGPQVDSDGNITYYPQDELNDATNELGRMDRQELFNQFNIHRQGGETSQSFKDALNAYLGTPTLGVGTPAGLIAAENGKLIGTLLSLASGVPGLRTLGGWLGDEYIDSNTFMSDGTPYGDWWKGEGDNPGPIQQYGDDSIAAAMENYINAGGPAPQMSPIEPINATNRFDWGTGTRLRSNDYWQNRRNAGAQPGEDPKPVPAGIVDAGNKGN